MSKNLYESEILSEMATLCSKKEGFGIVVVMHSDDHEPQHVHLSSIDNKEQTKIDISGDLPEDYKDLIIVKNCKDVSTGLKKSFLNWAKMRTIGQKINNWEFAKGLWFVFHNNRL